jgi:hypothetical protein
MNRLISKLIGNPNVVKNLRLGIFIATAVMALMASATGVAAGPDLGGP